MSSPRISVVIRAKDEAPSIGRVLELVAGQTVAAATQVIVVDSGSTDGTDRIARDAGAEVISIPAASFTFGGSLNTGCTAAEAEVVVALSAHAFPEDDGWLDRLAGCFDDPTVCAASGAGTGPTGEPLDGRVVQDEALARRYPLWGYESAAGAFRRSLWAQREFRADMPGTEDKEWAWHWLQRGHRVVLGPDLLVDHGHGKDPMRDQFVRARREWVGFHMYLDLEPYSAREMLGEWWREQETYAKRHRARLSHRRAARLAGRYMAQRDRRT